MSMPAAAERLLEERLAAARAVPPAERDAEVAAFLTGVELEREARAALPLPQQGGRAPPPRGLGAAAERRKILIAFLKAAKADYLFPVSMCPTRPATVRHLMAYLDMLWPGEPGDETPGCDGGGVSLSGSGSGKASSKASSGSARRQARRQQGKGAAAAGPPPPASPAVGDARGAPGGPLARALQLHFASPALRPRPEGFHVARDAAAILEDPVCQPLVQAALAELEGLAALGAPPPPAGQPAPAVLPTLDQLRFLFHAQTVYSAVRLLGQDAQAAAAPAAKLPAAEVRAVAAAAGAAAARLAALEPQHPLSWMMAGNPVAPSEPTWFEGQVKAYRLARQQGRPYYVAAAADAALAVAVGAASKGACTREQAAAALEAFCEAQEALRCCARVLPQVWVEPLQAGMEASKPLAEVLHRVLAEGGSGRPALPAAPPAGAPPQPAGAEGRPRCSGCGRQAASAAELKRCARCKRVQYCSRDCQMAAWTKHKLQCHAAQ